MIFSRSKPSTAYVPSTAAGDRIYAIGDIHGRIDLLRDLLNRIEQHSAFLAPATSMHVILLGDLIDRGSQSADVLKFVADIQQRTDRLIVLLGNHEDMMLKGLDGDKAMLQAWMRIGGRATLRSFGVEPPPRGTGVDGLEARVLEAIPEGTLEWMRKLPLTAKSGDYLFCHAGIRPGIPIKRQSRSDLLWIRDEFLDDVNDHGAVVVHGHSIATDVEIRHNRIGIDTGAYRTGVLTALYLEGTEREIISTSAAVAESPDEAPAPRSSAAGR